MPYQGSNAEYLHKINMYDLLMTMQKNLNEYCKTWYTVPCILDILGEPQGLDCCMDCKQCLADWLARERRNT